MAKQEPKKISQAAKFNLFAPIFRAAKLFEPPAERPNGSSEVVKQQEKLQEVRKNYLEYRNKIDGIVTASRLELDKTILTLSMQSIAFTFAIVSALHPHHHWQIQVAWIMWAFAMLFTLCSMMVAEYAAEKYKAILDDSYDIAVSDGDSHLPVAKALIKRSRFINWFISHNNGILNIFNYGSPAFFALAACFAVWWLLLIKGV